MSKSLYIQPSARTPIGVIRIILSLNPYTVPFGSYLKDEKNSFISPRVSLSKRYNFLKNCYSVMILHSRRVGGAQYISQLINKQASDPEDPSGCDHLTLDFLCENRFIETTVELVTKQRPTQELPYNVSMCAKSVKLSKAVLTS
ncbi:hypothetical protein STEG23_003399, partial [Scotinomys teguina]